LTSLKLTTEIEKPELINPNTLAALKEFLAPLSSDPETNQTILAAGVINLIYKIAPRKPTEEELNSILKLLFPLI